ncbi:MAG: DUF2062 domain-containing protein [Acidithiobacillus sp.]|nr:DUF2062 domain-containing protein [Acidithiobacillus sp.]
MHLPAFLRLPSREEILRKRPLGRFTHYLAASPNWHLHRRNVARGAAIGVFIGSLPYFGHVATILLICLWRRAYIPIAVIMPFVVTGPFTIVPFFYFAYQTGYWLLRQLHLAPELTIHYADIHRLFQGKIQLLRMGDRLWHAYWITWVGSVLLGAILATLTYAAILLGWRIWVNWRLHRRHQLRS